MVGALTIAAADSGNANPANLLQETGTTLITRDIAIQYNVKIGDRLRIADADGTALAQVLTVVGLVTDTPTHVGQRMFYSLQTAQALFSRSNIFDYVVVRVSPATIDVAASQLQVAGWDVKRVTPPPASTNFWGAIFTFEDVFDFMLRAAGVLGLIVGGIGIANTMQVMLTQRRKEVGILKTLGYSQHDMIMIFMLETGLLGLVGSVLGAILALLVGQAITQLFANISRLLVTWQFDLPITLSGIFIGLVTTTLFAFYAILRTSRTRPSVIFRQEASDAPVKRQWLRALGFYALLSIPFAGVTSVIMGTVIEGVGVILVALAGLIGFSILLGLSTWALLRIMPTFGSSFLRMARNNMRKRAWSMLFAMIALFVGIFTVGFAMTIFQVGIDQLTVRQDTSASQNLLVYADSTTMQKVIQVLAEQGASQIAQRYATPMMALNSADQHYYAGTLQARDTTWDIEIVDGTPFHDEQGGVYVYAGSSEKVGDEFTVRLMDGTTHRLTIAGHYRFSVRGSLLMGIGAPIVNRATLASLGIDQPQVTVYAIIDQKRETEIAQQIGDQFPQTMTLTRTDVVGEINQTFTNLLGFALAMAGLALLAGVMLIANVVSLSMIERRFEVGVMKSVGYTQQHILVLLALEYGLVGFIASLIGIVGVQVVIALLILAQSALKGILVLNPITGLIILGFGIALTLVTTLGSAWKPAHIRPSLLLSEQTS